MFEYFNRKLHSGVITLSHLRMLPLFFLQKIFKEQNRYISTVTDRYSCFELLSTVVQKCSLSYNRVTITPVTVWYLLEYLLTFQATLEFINKTFTLFLWINMSTKRVKPVSSFLITSMYWKKAVAVEELKWLFFNEKQTFTLFFKWKENTN